MVHELKISYNFSSSSVNHSDYNYSTNPWNYLTCLRIPSVQINTLPCTQTIFLSISFKPQRHQTQKLTCSLNRSFDTVEVSGLPVWPIITKNSIPGIVFIGLAMEIGVRLNSEPTWPLLSIFKWVLFNCNVTLTILRVPQQIIWCMAQLSPYQ